jgi:hypothetical protein
MRHTRIFTLLAATLVVTSLGLASSGDDTQRRSAPPSSKPESQPAPPPERAQPRTPPAGEAAAPPSEQARPKSESSQKAVPRRAPAPPPARALPPQYHAVPRSYYFPPVSLHRAYYYHPYFGFYYGPYYGPFYPFPGPFFGYWPHTTGAIRTEVKPVATEVYLNGYYAGLVDDFDGVFQRLYVPPGRHEIALQLEGFRTYRQRIYVAAGDTFDVHHQMQPLGPGEADEPLAPPGTSPREWTAAAPPLGERPASPFGILAVRVEPADAQIFVDEEAWVATGERTELVLHIQAGWHELEIRKDGYQTFRTGIELVEGVTTRLNVKLMK